MTATVLIPIVFDFRVPSGGRVLAVRRPDSADQRLALDGGQRDDRPGVRWGGIQHRVGGRAGEKG